ncbi:MAG TPA: SDR family oxidoreductase [bacterium]|jgi:uncharacterized protein YbjT (DUF2867 family)
MILVIGATGTVGRELVRLLASWGTPLRALVRTAERAKKIASAGIEVVIGDLSLPESLEPAFEGVARLFLLTPSHPRQVDLEANAIAKAKQAGVKYIVKLSTLGAKEDSPISMSRWHRQAERLVEKSEIAYSLLRSQHFMQNILTFAPSIRKQAMLRAPMETGRMSLVDARDVAAVAATLLTKPRLDEKILRITGSERLSFQDLADKLSDALGKIIRYEDISEEAFRAEWRQAGHEDWLIDDQIEIFRRFRDLQSPLVNDTGERITGRKPKTFADFARDYASSFKQN